MDDIGNIWVTVGPENPETLFSCHMDTVAVESSVVTSSKWAKKKLSKKVRKALKSIKGDRTTQKVHVSAEGIVSLNDPLSTCLGADDGVGMWLSSMMIAHGVPGLYIFHTGEECGGIGSSYIADKLPSMLDGVKRAVAFDRAGYGDVITHQMGQRCCSDDFGDALAEALGDGFLPDSTGVYTDTAEYLDIIPECTNISVGYAQQHGVNEWCDLHFANCLFSRLLEIDWGSLPTKRDPHGPVDYSGYYPGYGGNYGLYDWYGEAPTVYKSNGRPVKTSRDDNSEFAALIAEYPDCAADLLTEYGVTVSDFAERCQDETGDAIAWRFSL